MSRKLLVAIMRNEAPYILEWIAHHRALGFTDILIFTNDCTDGTDRMLDRLMDLRQVIHCPNPKSTFQHIPSWQVAAIRYASSFGLYRLADWACTIDADEFIEISVGDGTLDALLSAHEFDILSMPVLSYCSDSDPAIGDGSVLSRFKVPNSPFVPNSEWATRLMSVKSISRTNIERMHFRNHRPKISNFAASGRIWLDGAGKPMPAEFTDHKVNGHKVAEYPSVCHVNHFSIRSRDGFLVKMLRGDAVTVDRVGAENARQIQGAIKYWTARNPARTERREIRRPPRALELLAELHADPVLGELHEAACAIHCEAARKLLESPIGENLAAALVMRES